jgi:calcineurin-like phosphoesterase family protein/cadherin domain-containing protein
MSAIAVVFCAAGAAACLGGSPAADSATGADDPVIAAAGDIACPPGASISPTACHHAATSDLLTGATAVLMLGDAQYPDGTLAEFQESFDPTWGRFKSVMYPSVGNHEYHTPGAAGYFDYFGPAAGPRDKGYYSFDIGAWHLIALNSNCPEIGGCEEGSAQEQWLRADLAGSSASCTLAYWHHPLFSSGAHGSNPRMAAIWQTLYDHGVDVVLSGHDHNYQRFAPQTADGVADAQGPREFVVGTGGRSLYPTGPPIANQEAQGQDTFGVLKLTLHTTSYEWQFVPETGGTFGDMGSATCVGPGAENSPPAITSDGGDVSASISVPENQTAVTNVQADDPDGDPLTYSIEGGADADAFRIEPSSGALSFTTIPDFETPADADGDNVYLVTVSVTDGRAASDTQELAVQVTNRPELYLTLRDVATLGDVVVANEDVISHDDVEGFQPVFDGSDVGLAAVRIDAFAWLDADTLLLSFAADGEVVPDIATPVDGEDIVRFDASSLGSTTAGTFSVYFDGSDLGLTEKADEVDALETLPDGRIVISTVGPTSAAQVAAADEDLLVLEPSSLGETTAGILTQFFDGKDVGLGDVGEDVDGAAIGVDGQIYLSTRGAFSVSGLAGDDEDVFVFSPTSLGPTTEGSYSPALFFDGSAFGLEATNVTDMDLP